MAAQEDGHEECKEDTDGKDTETETETETETDTDN